jgi:hypothetical protein
VARRAVAELVGTFLLATVVGSGIMAERLAGRRLLLTRRRMQKGPELLHYLIQRSQAAQRLLQLHAHE